jgi:hypothetical protein
MSLNSMMNLVAENGEKHGIINRLANSVKDDGFQSMDAKTKSKAEKLREEEKRIVKARYMNHRGQNERLTKPYCRWAGDSIDIWHMIPNHVYDVPMGLVNEINDPNKRLAKRSEILDKNGVPTKKDGPGEQIHELVPVSF